MRVTEAVQTIGWRGFERFMERRGLTPARWARSAGVSPNTIYNWKAEGTVRASGSTLGKLAQATGLSMDQLLRELMAGPDAASPTALYDEDFYAWTQQQAAVLRTLREGNRLDAERLAEEIEDLGKSDLHAVESFIEQIVAHLLKLDYSWQDDARQHWRAEVLNFRRNAERKITPSIRRILRPKLPELYRNARQMAAIGAVTHEPDLGRRLPRTCPYDWSTIWHRDVLAEAGLDLSEEAKASPTKRR